MWSPAEPGCGPMDSAPVRPPQFHRRRAAVAISSSLRLLCVCMALISMISIVSAQDFVFEAASYDTPLFRRLEGKGQIFFDRRDPPPVPGAVLERRQEGESSSISTSIPRTSSTSSVASTATFASIAAATSSVSNSTVASDSPTSGLSVPATATAATPSVTVVTTPIPSPFDSSLGSNFTAQTCPDFFNSFLNNATFQSCVPVSLLLQNSKSFFGAARSPVLLAETLNIACAAPLPICQPLMASLASNLISSSHCGADYQAENPLVSQAHAGLVAYEAIYQATCLKSNETGNYCFADAISNQLNPSDAYPYYAGVGLKVPPASHPTCSQCLRQTMSIFAGYAKDKNQPLATTYINTAQAIDVDCGAQFADTTVPVGTMSGSTSGADRRAHSSLAAIVVALAFAFVLT